MSSTQDEFGFKPAQVRAVSLSEAANRHRYVPEVVDVGALPTPSTLDVFVRKLRGFVRDASADEEFSVEKSRTQLEQYLDEYRELATRGGNVCDLTKSWVMGHSGFFDLAAVASSPLVGLDDVLVRHLVQQALLHEGQKAGYVIGLLAERLLDPAELPEGSKLALVFMEAMQPISQEHASHKWLADACVDFYQEFGNGVSDGMGVLGKHVINRLLDYSVDPRVSMLERVAACLHPDVRANVMDAAHRLGQIDPAAAADIERRAMRGESVCAESEGRDFLAGDDMAMQPH